MVLPQMWIEHRTGCNRNQQAREWQPPQQRHVCTDQLRGRGADRRRDTNAEQCNCGDCQRETRSAASACHLSWLRRHRASPVTPQTFDMACSPARPVAVHSNIWTGSPQEGVDHDGSAPGRSHPLVHNIHTHRVRKSPSATRAVYPRLRRGPVSPLSPTLIRAVRAKPGQSNAVRSAPDIPSTHTEKINCPWAAVALLAEDRQPDRGVHSGLIGKKSYGGNVAGGWSITRSMST